MCRFTCAPVKSWGSPGLVGAGRTELARVLFGLTPADAGELLIRGRPVSIDSPARAVALGIGYVPEDRRRHGVILDMPVAANTTLATLRAVSRFGLLDFRRERAMAARLVRPARDQDRRRSKLRWATCPAATSRKSRSPAGWPARPRS